MASSNPKEATRRPHKKSRYGCKSCKTRRLKVRTPILSQQHHSTTTPQTPNSDSIPSAMKLNRHVRIVRGIAYNVNTYSCLSTIPRFQYFPQRSYLFPLPRQSQDGMLISRVLCHAIPCLSIFQPPLPLPSQE